MRPFLAPLTALLVLASTGTALAGTPPTISVDPNSLASGKPTFTWAIGAESETITSISFGTSPTPDFVGRISGSTISVPTGATSIASPAPAWAGTNYFNGYWYSPTSTGGQGYTPVASFEMPPVAKFYGVGIQQSRRSPNAMASGKLGSNSRTKVTVTCTIKQGRMVLNTKTSSVQATVPGIPRSFACSMIVSEDLDGKSLTLLVTAKVGAKTFKKSLAFVAS